MAHSIAEVFALVDRLRRIACDRGPGPDDARRGIRDELGVHDGTIRDARTSGPAQPRRPAPR